jgi:hypothetical protein
MPVRGIETFSEVVGDSVLLDRGEVLGTAVDGYQGPGAGPQLEFHRPPLSSSLLVG